jgi:hypothetical protein
MILASHGIIGSISGVDADWLAYYNRVIAAGGSLTTTEQAATLQLVLDLKANSLWTPMKAIYPMVGASAAACAQNLKSSSFTGTFTSGWTFASTGVTPNGTSAYMNTGFSPTVNLTNYSAHSSVYNRINGSNTGFDLGITNQNAGYLNEFLLASYRGGQSISAFYDYTNALSQVVVSAANGKGFFNGSITSNTNQKLYKNGTSIGSNTLLNTSTPSNYPIYLGAVNNQDASAVEYTQNQYAFMSIGDGLTDTQASNLYTSVQTFQTTLSRQV